MTNLIRELADCEDFLETVWGKSRGWIDLPTKVGQYWVPFHAEWPDDEGAITRRIDSAIRDRENLYFSVALFRKRGRRIEDVLPTRWLWADLDFVHPSAGTRIGYHPTIAWESSPGRYQALWKLSRELGTGSLEKLNRAMTYALDADKGGWDLTQVLRLPGSRNWKYPGGPAVRVLWYEPEEVFDPTEVWSTLKEGLGGAELGVATGRVLPRRGLPSAAKRLLRTPVDQVVEGERSTTLWKLECLLAEAGLTEGEIFDLVWPCAWNKWRGINTGKSRLAREIRKAMAHVRRRKPEPKTTERKEFSEGKEATRVDDSDESAPLPWVPYASFMAMTMEEPKWLIKDLWVADSHGIIGGEPKTQKTTLALAMALAVASGGRMLGRWPVGKQGPVLMVQEENAPWMIQDRLRKLAAYMGLISTQEAHERVTGPGSLGKTAIELDFPVDLPLKLLNNFGFDLGVEEHRDMLEGEVEAMRPALVILDPLYLILGTANENQSHELRPFLKWIMQLRYRYGCAVAVVHHMRKAQAGTPGVRSGQRLMGNATLHGWIDSALYTSQLDDMRVGWTKAKIETEFRSMAPRPPFELALRFEDPGSLLMSLDIQKYSIEGLIVKIVTEEPNITVTKLAEILSIDKRTVLARCRGSEQLVVEGGRKGRGHSWRVSLNGDSDHSE